MLVPGGNTAASSPSDLVLKATEVLFPMVRAWLAEHAQSGKARTGGEGFAGAGLPSPAPSAGSVGQSPRSPARREHQPAPASGGSGSGATAATATDTGASAACDWTLLSKESPLSQLATTARGQPPDTRLMHSLLYLLEYFRFAGSTADAKGSHLRNQLVLDLCVPLVEVLWNRVPAKRILLHVVSMRLLVLRELLYDEYIYYNAHKIYCSTSTCLAFAFKTFITLSVFTILLIHVTILNIMFLFSESCTVTLLSLCFYALESFWPLIDAQRPEFIGTFIHVRTSI